MITVTDMSHFPELDRQTAIRRQLETAIMLFFWGADPIVVHLLAASASQVLTDLGTQRGIKLTRHDIETIYGEDSKDVFYLMNEKYNFLKHADRSPEKTVRESWIDDNDGFLYSACRDYFYMFGHYPDLFHFFALWIVAVHGPDPHATDSLHVLKNAYPELSTLDRGAQIEEGRILLMKFGARRGFPPEIENMVKGATAAISVLG